MMRRAWFLLAALPFSANAQVASHFDTGTEDWQTVNLDFPSLTLLGVQAPTWTGSSITGTEFGSGLYLFAAPVKFLGDKRAYFGGTLGYRLADATSDGTPYPTAILRGNGIALYYTTPAPGTSLTSTTVSLTPSGWLKTTGGAPTEAEFKTVLSNLDAFGINADWTTNGRDVVELDDVVMAVPEPTTIAAMILGLGAVLGRRKSRR